MHNWVYGKHSDLDHGRDPQLSLEQTLGMLRWRETVGAKRGCQRGIRGIYAGSLVHVKHSQEIRGP